MVTVAQTIKYLNMDALRSMRFVALLPTHALWSHCFLSVSPFLSDTHTLANPP